jgi:pyruvate/2-oxoglutarate dehydrogenase complex dihydrolipoamide dehydrogenase (E3) component
MAYRIAVVGSGYVGLVTGLCFAETGNHVVCVDIDQQKVEQLNRGQLPIYEPGLGVLLERNLRNGAAGERGARFPSGAAAAGAVERASGDSAAECVLLQVRHPVTDGSGADTTGD